MFALLLFQICDGNDDEQSPAFCRKASRSVPRQCFLSAIWRHWSFCGGMRHSGNLVCCKLRCQRFLLCSAEITSIHHSKLNRFITPESSKEGKISVISKTGELMSTIMTVGPEISGLAIWYYFINSPRPTNERPNLLKL